MTMHALYTRKKSPVGDIVLVMKDGALTRLYIEGFARSTALDPAWKKAPEAFRDVSRQLDEYFAGERKTFDVRLAQEGTPFQHRVWKALVKIPYGAAVSYVDIARKLGMPNGARAVGSANARNTVAIIVPCHRVIGAGGSLTGYAFGTPNKQLLLDLEAGRPWMPATDVPSHFPLKRKRRDPNYALSPAT